MFVVRMELAQHCAAADAAYGLVDKELLGDLVCRFAVSTLHCVNNLSTNRLAPNVQCRPGVRSNSKTTAYRVSKTTSVQLPIFLCWLILCLLWGWHLSCRYRSMDL